MANTVLSRRFTVKQGSDGCFHGCFDAMASPCEVLIDSDDEKQATVLTELAAREAWRIEQKYSRYRDDGIVPRINREAGQAVPVDDETARLLDFAWQCYRLSDGLFDISSGVLRKLWKFDGSDRVPDADAVAALLPYIGLDKASWQAPWVKLAPGMEIDLGGIGKEYAVDRVLQLMTEQHPLPVLVNFGGDIAASAARRNGQPWRIGIEALDRPDQASGVLQLYQGGVATSGDSKRFLLKEGVRYSHILNPKTGWPVAGCPHAITVQAQNCTNAGILATLAMLQGEQAETFLQQQQVRYSLQR